MTETKPAWMGQEAIDTLSNGYLLPGETPFGMFSRVATTVEKYIPEPGLAGDIFDCLWKGYIGCASPVASNFGTNRGLPISCYALTVDDDLHSIYSHLKEAAALSKYGGGVGCDFHKIRPAGSPISAGGKSSGIVPWMRQYDLSAAVVSQGGVRRGSFALYLPIDHPDLEELLRCKDHAQGDPRSFIDSNIAVTVTDQFLEEMLAGDEHKKEIFSKVLELRMVCGSPYIVFIDNVNNQNPECYKSRGLKVSTSNLCFTGDTLVAVADGRPPVKIKDLENTNFPVYSARKTTKNTWKTEIKSAKAFKTGTSKVVEVVLSDGSSFKCTEDHELATIDGEWVKARNSVSKVLAPFTSYTNEYGHRVINSTTNGYAKQGRMIWEYHNGSIPKGMHLDHIVSQGGDNIENLQLLTQQEHIEKTRIERRGERNPIFKRTPEERSKSSSYSSMGIKNPQYSGIDNYELISLGQELYSRTKSFSRKEYLELRDSGYNVPTTFSKYRFNKSFSEYKSYVVGDKVYDGRYEIEPVKPTNKRVEKEELKTASVKHLLGGLEVLSVRELDKEVPVYDLCVEDNHNFYIVTSNNQEEVSSGVLVHNCSEITLYSDENHTFVCVLSSLNLARWDEWKDYVGKSTGKSVPELMVYLLDAVCEEFIVKASRLPSMGRAVRFAKKSRALGAGTMGLAALYQSKRLPFQSEEARTLNIEIHKYIHDKAKQASRDLAASYGEPEWCEGSGYRHTHLLATAPTRTNSVISGAISQGIEPLESNLFVAKQAKGTFIRRNPYLEALLEEKGQNNDEVWDSLIATRGSVSHLDFLTDYEKQVFLTAREIDQLELIRQAAERQPFICQAQSLNLFIEEDTPAEEIWQMHLVAWRYGLKSLYYLRSSSKLNERERDIDAYNNVVVTKPGCPFCDKAKQFLKVRGISFVEMTKEKALGAGYYRELHGTFPQIHIDKNFIGGYDELLDYFGQIPLVVSASECVACEG